MFGSFEKEAEENNRSIIGFASNHGIVSVKASGFLDAKANPRSFPLVGLCTRIQKADTRMFQNETKYLTELSFTLHHATMHHPFFSSPTILNTFLSPTQEPYSRIHTFAIDKIFLGAQIYQQNALPSILNTLSSYKLMILYVNSVDHPSLTKYARLIKWLNYGIV